MRRSVLSLGLILALAQAVPALAQEATVLGRGEFRTGTAVAEVVEARRKDGILTAKVRFRVADGAEFGANEIIYSQAKDGYAQAYLIAGDKKYFALKDAEGAPLMPPSLLLMGPKQSGPVGLWWGKFPAPPAEIKAFSLTLPGTAPIDEIPISDG